VRAALTERLGLKATALLIAVLLWLVVSAREPVQEYVPVHVMPTLDSTLVLLEEPPALKALVTGRAVDIVKLRANPPAIHRIVEDDVPDTLVLPVTPDDVRVPAELADHVHVLDVQPRSIALRFGTKARILLRRDTTLVPARNVTMEPSSVRITGPRLLVRRITSMRPFSMTIAEGDTTAHFADLDTVGLGVHVTPARVKIIVRK
jgi:hypothetical protein